MSSLSPQAVSAFDGLLISTLSLKPATNVLVSGYLEISVFENQRYRLVHKWGSNNLYPLDPNRFTNSDNHSVSITSLTQTDILLPSSYEWASDWQINSIYTTQDQEGWSYGSTFGRLAAKVLSNRSKDTPNKYHYVRRRLWYRLLRPSHAVRPITIHTILSNEVIESLSPTLSFFLFSLFFSLL